MIQFNSETCQDLKNALSREWLETNGLGGFTSSTIVGLNTRRYHGLLTAALKPPLERHVLLSKLEETLIIDGKRFELSCNQYPGVIHPQGFKFLKMFRLDPFPIFTYSIEGYLLEKSLFMIYGENSTVIQYQLFSKGVEDSKNVALEVRPLIAFRNYHNLTHENQALNSNLEVDVELVSIAPYTGLPALFFAHDGYLNDRNGFWFLNFEYEKERERGLDFEEDLFSPFTLRFNLSKRNSISIIVSTEAHNIALVGDYRYSELHRRRAILVSAPIRNEFIQTLTAAGDQFLVNRASEKTTIAGYHWFGDWGRDTMIALSGLTLVTRRFEVAKSILLQFAQSVSQGMLPNRFPEAGEITEYNTVDASLWYCEAVRALLQYTNDYHFVKTQIYPVLVDIVEWYIRGTRYGIRVDTCGLLHAGEPGVQLTWMDAKVGDWVVTPREGKPVEIQALWYNALCVLADLAEIFGDKSRQQKLNTLMVAAKKNFNELFWNNSLGCLYDVVDGDNRDASVRPNQILAVSLKHTMLLTERARQVVKTVERELFTPYGLRSLSIKDPQYRGRYEGNVLSRDGAYHQGAVWSWLMGPFITAYIKVSENSDSARTKALGWLAAFEAHLTDAGLGSISEIFDGDSPHTPRGCIAQAWSVAELLRAALEDIYVGKKIGAHYFNPTV